MNLKTQLRQTLSSKHFSTSNKVNRVVYGKLITAKCTSPVKSQLKWNERIVLYEGCTADWKSAYCLAAKCTKSTKLINFQYRLLHRILPTNLFLAKIKIKQDPNCSFCHNYHENLIHLFWDCEIVSTFWENMTEKLKQCNLISINYQKNISIYLGLRPDTSQFSLQLNFCFLLARHHIWSCRANNKTSLLTSFLVRLKSPFNIESNNPCLVSKKWNPLLPLLNIS